VPILTAEPSSETFPCPNCNEFIAGNSTQCRYCSTVIPPYYAQSAAEAQNRINKACDEAGWLRAFTGAMWVFFFVRVYSAYWVRRMVRNGTHFFLGSGLADLLVDSVWQYSNFRRGLRNRETQLDYFTISLALNARSPLLLNDFAAGFSTLVASRL
jgi:hypothetical protein